MSATAETTPAILTGANVRAEMARRGVSQVALAEHMGKTQAAISARILGRVPFDINELTSVAAFLGVPLTALIPAPEAAAS